MFRLIGADKTTGVIARARRFSVKSAESHRAHITAKLELESGAALARYATQWAAAEGIARYVSRSGFHVPPTPIRRRCLYSELLHFFKAHALTLQPSILEI